MAGPNEMAAVNGLSVEEIILQEQKRWQNPALQHLESYFDSRPVQRYKGESSIHLAEAVNRRAEIEGVARNIRRLVHEENYRYRDIALLMRNGQDYHEVD